MRRKPAEYWAKSLDERFDEFVRKDKSHHWWTGPVSRNSSGAYYGYFQTAPDTGPRVKGRATRQVLAHRFAYMRKYGRIPKGYHIDHTCENKLCVNPSHLECVTPKEHARRHKERRALKKMKKAA